MKLLNRYIGYNVFIATGLVVAILGGIEVFMLFFGEVGDIGKAHYTINKVLLYVLMQLPFQLYQLFPMAGFLGCLVGLGRLSASSELVVMRASGISITEIAISVIKAALIMILIVTLMGEGVAPSLQSFSERMKAAALGKQRSYSGLGGVWLRNQDEFIHFGQVSSLKKAKNISTFRMKDHQLLQTSFAANARKRQEGWLVSPVLQTDLGGSSITSQTFPSKLLKTDFDPALLSLGQISIDQLSIKGLYQSIQYRQAAKLDVLQFQFAFWQRLFQPFMTIIMICLGVPFIFVMPRSQSMGLRVLWGIIIGFAFYTLNQFIGPLAVVYQISPVFAAIVPLVTFLVACVMLFRRV